MFLVYHFCQKIRTRGLSFSRETRIVPVPVPAPAFVCLIKDSRVWKGIFEIWDSAEIQCGIGKDARIVDGKRYLPVTRGAGCATSNVIVLFPTRSIRQMLANFSGVEF